MLIPLNFTARDYQAEAMSALESGVSMAVLCWARRAGKDFTCFAYAVKKMVEQPMNVVLVFPNAKQGYDNFWTNVENDGMKTLDHIPEVLVESRINSPNNMKITLKNGSTFSLLGASEPDKLRGANAKLYIFSEFVDIDSAALDVIIPIVEVNGGQIILQSTPKIDGISGATFKTLFDLAEKCWADGDKSQFASRITAREYLSDRSLERIRQNTIAKNGNDFWFKQEFECDWGQASSSSYYGAALQAAKEAGHIRFSPYREGLPVYTAWDLGVSDTTAIVFWQMVGTVPHIIDFYETHDIGYKAIVDFLKLKNYNYGHHFLPWDGSTREASDVTARIDKLQDMGLINATLLRREAKDDGINRAVIGAHRAIFHEPTTEYLRRKLQLYKRKYNPLTGDYIGPEHKTESNAADSFRYMFAAIDQEFDAKTGGYLYPPEATQRTYESGLYTSPKLYRPA